MIAPIGSIGYSNLLEKSQEFADRAASASTGVGAAEGLSSFGQLQSISSPEKTSGSPSFSDVLEQAVKEVDGKMKASEADQNKLLSGESDNLHQTMISIQEANVAFSLMVEVRNKLTDSYQELMRMQV
jgi:flagellar hook-basal body complex protein FliE